MELTKRSLAGVALLGPFAARAQARPSRPVRIVVPTGAGGITDILARMVGQRLAERLGQPVVIDNRPGADGIVGTEAAARAAPDGHTLLMVFPSHTLNPALRRTLPYDTERDFAPIGTVSTVSLALLVAAASPARDIEGLVALARRDRLTYATVGAGSLGHLGAELFRSTAGIELTHVPFRSTPEAQTALLRGDVSLFFDTPITALPMLRDGRSASPPPHATRPCPTFRPSWRPVCPGSTWRAGTGSSHPPARPARSSSAFRKTCGPSSASRRCARAWPSRAPIPPPPPPTPSPGASATT